MQATDNLTKLRAALADVPCIRWTATGATVSIPETEDWAGKDISITGLDKQVGRKLARYIADANPAAVQSLLASHDALLAALWHAVRFHDQLTPADIERYTAVIAKATGVQA